jgi:hypothetical protein
MKAISLWQPWASLIVHGKKKIETRHWSTNYRGPLLIHAAKKKDGTAGMDEADIAPLADALSPIKLHTLPLGALIGVVDLVDCKPTEQFDPLEINQMHINQFGGTWSEYQLGNFGPGRFGWVLDNPRKFETPIPYRGSQGFFEVSAEVLSCLAAD